MPPPTLAAAFVVALGEAEVVFVAVSVVVGDSVLVIVSFELASSVVVVVVAAGGFGVGLSMPFPSDTSPKAGLKLVCDLSASLMISTV